MGLHFTSHLIKVIQNRLQFIFSSIQDVLLALCDFDLKSNDIRIGELARKEEARVKVRGREEEREPTAFIVDSKKRPQWRARAVIPESRATGAALLMQWLYTALIGCPILDLLQRGE